MTKFQKLLMMFRPISEMVYLERVNGYMKGFHEGSEWQKAKYEKAPGLPKIPKASSKVLVFPKIPKNVTH